MKAGAEFGPTIFCVDSKVPLEFLFLETGSLSVKDIISSRRMNYLRTLLRREDDELTKRILREQEKNPTAGDFTDMIKDDFKMCLERTGDYFITRR